MTKKETNKGLGLVPRLLIGNFAIILGTLIILTARTVPDPFSSVCVGIFFIIIAVACYTTGKQRQIAGSIIGLFLFFLAFAYILYSQITAGPITYNNKNEQSVMNSIWFMIFFGIPGLIYTLKTKFGYTKKNEEP